MTALSGVYVTEGSAIAALDEESEFDVTVTVKVGDKLHGGDIYAQCPETPLITHRCTVPPYTEGTVEYVAPDGKYKVNDVIVKTQDRRRNGAGAYSCTEVAYQNAKTYK